MIVRYIDAVTVVLTWTILLQPLLRNNLKDQKEHRTWTRMQQSCREPHHLVQLLRKQSYEIVIIFIFIFIMVVIPNVHMRIGWDEWQLYTTRIMIANRAQHQNRSTLTESTCISAVCGIFFRCPHRHILWRNRPQIWAALPNEEQSRGGVQQPWRGKKDIYWGWWKIFLEGEVEDD